jgi:hypothetical protein
MLKFTSPITFLLPRIKVLLLLLLLYTSCVIHSQPNKLNKNLQRKGKWLTYDDSLRTIKSFEGRFRNGKSVGKSIYYFNGKIDRIEKKRFRKLKTTLYYADGKIKAKGNARLINGDSLMHYFFYGKWKYFDENGKLFKYVYFDNGQITKTDYLHKTNNLSYDSLIVALNRIDKEYLLPRIALTDSFSVARDNPLKQKKLLRMAAQYDSLSMVHIEKILDTYGYPSRAYVGQACEIPFYAINYAPLDKQEKYLPIIIKAADEQTLSWSSVAIFVDKFKVAKKEKQIYGTQYYQKNGETILYPIEDELQVNERRLKIGLEAIGK